MIMIKRMIAPIGRHATQRFSSSLLHCARLQYLLFPKFFMFFSGVDIKNIEGIKNKHASNPHT